jgi:hypothetical protein
MGMSAYMARLRASVGHDLLLVPATGACIWDEEGRILLLQRSDGENLWGFPGGAIEPNERAADAIVREVREEIGLEVESSPLPIPMAIACSRYSFSSSVALSAATCGPIRKKSWMPAILSPEMSCPLCAHAASPRRGMRSRIAGRRSFDKWDGSTCGAERRGWRWVWGC